MTLPYRPNVCILLFNTEKKLFLGERKGSTGVYQFPQGGVEEGSSLEENVIREIEEETGISPSWVTVIKQLKAKHQYDFSVTPSYAEGKWRGQSQTFWLVSFTGNDSHVNLTRGEPEFSNYLWCAPEEVRNIAEAKRRSGYEAPLEEAKAYFNSLKV